MNEVAMLGNDFIAKSERYSKGLTKPISTSGVDRDLAEGGTGYTNHMVTTQSVGICV